MLGRQCVDEGQLRRPCLLGGEQLLFCSQDFSIACGKLWGDPGIHPELWKLTHSPTPRFTPDFLPQGIIISCQSLAKGREGHASSERAPFSSEAVGF